MSLSKIKNLQLPLFKKQLHFHCLLLNTLKRKNTLQLSVSKKFDDHELKIVFIPDWEMGLD